MKFTAHHTNTVLWHSIGIDDETGKPILEIVLPQVGCQSIFFELTDEDWVQFKKDPNSLDGLAEALRRSDFSNPSRRLLVSENAGIRGAWQKEQECITKQQPQPTHSPVNPETTKSAERKKELPVRIIATIVFGAMAAGVVAWIFGHGLLFEGIAWPFFVIPVFCGIVGSIAAGTIVEAGVLCFISAFVVSGLWFIHGKQQDSITPIVAVSFIGGITGNLVSAIIGEIMPKKFD